MAIRRNGEILRRLTTLFSVGTFQGLSDGELLERFLIHESEAAEPAFAALVDRHGPMVLRVCQRVLHDPHDAHDAFQATFLVLARRGRTLKRRDSVASWLHGVALRVAGCARRSAARRRAHEQRRAGRVREAALAPCDDAADVGIVLHEELGRLPERYRAPVILCYLEGLTCEEAAGQLGWPVGTVKSRLARARERLRGQLSRRGLGSVGIGSFLSPEKNSIALPAARAVFVGTVPAVAELTQGVLRMMFQDQLRYASVAILTLGLGVTSAVALARPGTDGPPSAAAAASEPSKSPPDRYVVEPPDLIVIEILHNLPGQPIAGERLVRPDGTVSLGFYGDVSVAGLTLEGVKLKVIAKLRENLSDEQLGLIRPDPQRPGQNQVIAAKDSTNVMVDVAAYNSKYYYVQGDVAVPGKLHITGKEFVLDAIHYAGGILPPADRKYKIRLVRPRVVGPRPRLEQSLPVDLNAIINGDESTNYRMQPGDRLVVYRDPIVRSKDQPGTGNEAESLERRLESLEQRLDRVIQLLEAAQPNRPEKPESIFVDDHYPARSRKMVHRVSRTILGPFGSHTLCRACCFNP